MDEESFGVQIFDSSTGVELELNIVKLEPDTIDIELEGRGVNLMLNVTVRCSTTQSTAFSLSYLETKTATAKVATGQLMEWKSTQQILLEKGANALIYPPLSVKVFSKL
jgi:hypothetical protein